MKRIIYAYKQSFSKAQHWHMHWIKEQTLWSTFPCRSPKTRWPIWTMTLAMWPQIANKKQTLNLQQFLQLLGVFTRKQSLKCFSPRCVTVQWQTSVTGRPLYRRVQSKRKPKFLYFASLLLFSSVNWRIHGLTSAQRSAELEPPANLKRLT